MLENAIVACPEDLWGDRSVYHEYWYWVYHTLFFLDYYSSGTDKGFAPPSPITLSELDPAGGMPERVYTKDEMLSYLNYGRNKSRAAIVSLTDDNANERCDFNRPELTIAELLLYNMRHVQHHTAQLNLLLRLRINSAPKWVGKTKIKLSGE